MTKPAALLLILVSVTPLALGQQEPTQVRPPAETMRPEITGARGIVAGGRNFSVAAGLKIIQMGGNAVDAGVAAGLPASGFEISPIGVRGGWALTNFVAQTPEAGVVEPQRAAPDG